MAASPIIRIGTAGWSVPSRYAKRFPGPGTHLQRYARVMIAAEINSSFYRPHRRETYERWASSTPAGFRFSVKTPRQLTHEQKLADPEPVLDRFADELAGLGRKLGAILVQLPPKLAFDAPTADGFFDALRDRFAAPVVCEPRHASWFTAEVDTWLKKRRIARVAADPARAPGAERPGGWRGLTYIRLHGSPRMYYSPYSAKFLRATAKQLNGEKAPVWCIFDNTASSAALGDPLAIKDRLKR